MRTKVGLTLPALLLAGGLAWGAPITTYDGTLTEWSVVHTNPTTAVFSMEGVLVEMDTDGDSVVETYEASFNDFLIDTTSGVNLGAGIWEFDFAAPISVMGLRIFDGPVNGVLDGFDASFDIILNSLIVAGNTSGTIDVVVEVDILLNTNNSPAFDFSQFAQGDFVMTVQITPSGGLPGLLTSLLNGVDIPPGNRGTSGSFSATAASVVPEPTTMLLLGAGFVAAALNRKKMIR